MSIFHTPRAADISVAHMRELVVNSNSQKRLVSILPPHPLAALAIMISISCATTELCPGMLPYRRLWTLSPLFVGSAAWFEDNPRQIVDFAFKTRLPALYIRREYVEIGGVMSYGVDFREMYRNAAQYIVRVLKGEKPADLPVIQPTKIELVINLKSMKSLGLSTTPPLLARADEVIE